MAGHNADLEEEGGQNEGCASHFFTHTQLLTDVSPEAIKFKRKVFTCLQILSDYKDP